MENKFLSLEWFKERIELSVEKATEKIVTQQLEKLMGESNEPEQHATDKKSLFKHLTLVNDVLTVILEDGTILTKSDATQEDFHNIKKATNEVELFMIIASPQIVQEREEEEKEVRRVESLIKGIELLEWLDDFTVDENVVYLTGTSRSLPQTLVEKFIEVVGRCLDTSVELNEDEEYNSLKRFFMWCCLNPRAEVANDLYDFLDRNSFRITKQGFFVALRNVVSIKPGKNKHVSFVSQAYNKVKAVWKKNPKDWSIVEDERGRYDLVKNSKITGKVKLLGTVTDLYMNLPDMTENRFTDAHTRTFDIRVGRVVNMPMEECSWSTADCMEAGLHFTADQIHYVGCGDTSVLVLINPMKVVGIGHSKGRCYEYLPIMTVPREEATKILHDVAFDTLELDEDYAIRELEDLAVKAQEGFIAETTKHQFNLPNISTKEIRRIVTSLSEMKSEIDKRIVKLD
jgi:hypothetical protein